MAAFEFLAAIITVIALVLLIISFLAYRTEGSLMLLLTSIVFLLFFIEGIILTLSIFVDDLESFSSDLTFVLLINVVILLILFFSVFNLPKKEKATEKPPEKKDDKKT
jgi:cytochrome bd-type quinol oxidase subunit 2